MGTSTRWRCPLNLAIETFSLTKRFPPYRGWRSLLLRQREQGLLALDGVSLTVGEGEIFGLLGPNGAGKTTLVRLLCTLVLPTAGSAHICGCDLADEVAIKALIGLATGEERSFYWRLSGGDNLRFYGALHGLSAGYVNRRIAALDGALGLEEALAGRFDRLSTGMRRRLDIARALLHDPRVLFLDEPTRSLDPGATARLHDQVRRIARTGHTVFLVTHQLSEAEALCDRVAILHRGRLQAVAPVAELRRALGPRRRYLLTLLVPADASTVPWAGWPWPVEELPGDAPRRRLAVALPDGLPLDVLLQPLLAAGVSVVDATTEGLSLEEVFQRLTEAETPEGAASADAGRARPFLPTPAVPTATAAPAGPTVATAAVPAPERPSTLASLLRKTGAFLRRDVQTQLSYRLSTLLQLLGIIFSVTAFYFVARVFGPAASPYLAEYGGNYFAFVLVGIAFAAYQSVGLFSFSEAIRAGQTQGTLEALLVTPTRLETILGASALWSFALATLQVLAYLLVGALLFGAPLGQANLATALCTLLLSLLAFSGLGILSASVILVTKRGDPVNFLFASLSTLLSGVYYPVGVLPGWLQPVSTLLPLTHALKAMRLALLEGAGLAQVAPDLALLALFSLLVLPSGVFAFRWALRRARQEGSLTQY